MENILKEILANMELATNFEMNTKLEDLGIDSLMLLELIVEVEDALKFTFDESDLEMENFITIESLLNVINKYVGK